jgi:hypothetical protein
MGDDCNSVARGNIHRENDSAGKQYVFNIFHLKVPCGFRWLKNPNAVTDHFWNYSA